jgi:hypothetical protein
MNYKPPDLQQRQKAAAASKKALLDKHRTAANDPAAAERQAARAAVSDARLVRASEREAAKKSLPRNLPNKLPALLTLPCRPNVKPKMLRPLRPPKRPIATRRLLLNKRRPVMLGMAPARLPRSSGGAATDGLITRSAFRRRSVAVFRTRER